VKRGETILPNPHPRRGSAITAKLAIAAAILASASAVAAPGDKHHGATNHAPAGQQQIACTVLGCMPIPAACTPVAGKTPGGRPTGYDVIVCPPDVRPLQ